MKEIIVLRDNCCGLEKDMYQRIEVQPFSKAINGNGPLATGDIRSGWDVYWHGANKDVESSYYSPSALVRIDYVEDNNV